MAAIVCKGLCNCLGNCCKAIGDCLDGCCEGCGNCCNKFTQVVGEFLCPEDRPAPICPIFVCCVNFLPGFLCVAIAAISFDNQCEKPVDIFLLVNGILCFVNFAFALYVYWRWSLKTDEKVGAFQRSWKILCYDPIVLVYFFVYAFVFVWQIIGTIWMGGNCDPSGDDDLLVTVARFSSIIMWVYIALGTFMAFCTICVEWLAKFMHESSTNVHYSCKETTDDVSNKFGGKR